MFKHIASNKTKIAIVGLGYVGLPLATLFSKKNKVIGFDINTKRIQELNDGIDKTNEVNSKDFLNNNLLFTTDSSKMIDCELIIITVPTPIDNYKKPDLSLILFATELVGKILQSGQIVVYESTVYPGVTEEECVPILEKISGLNWKKDFFVGYSPERVNPGDKEHTIDKIKKIVSADTPKCLEYLSNIYQSIVTVGVYKAASIKTAEAAKVIENTQRDLNISLMNELSMIFNKLDINTFDVLEAAGTKWNFLPFTPGLVGGHCIGVDPYYLTFKAEAIGYNPQVILAGRRINDRMGNYIAEQTIKSIIKAGKQTSGEKVLIIGFTFKENIPDLRNTKVIDIYNELKEYGIDPIVYDPHIDLKELKKEYGIEATNIFPQGNFAATIIAVFHKACENEININKLCEIQEGTKVIIDVKGKLKNEVINNHNEIIYFSL